MKLGRMRSKPNSLVAIFVNFVRANPKAAATLAFELGLLGGEMAKRVPWGRLKDASPNLTAMPSRISNAALKLIPAAPDLQPANSTRAKKSKKQSPRRKSEKANGQKSQKHNDGHSKI
jgi:hypothetical protein